MKHVHALSLAFLLSLCSTPVTAQQDAFSLEGLVITATPTPLSADAVANHVTVLTAEDLGPYGVRPLSEVLRSLPGVEVTRNGSFGAVTSVFLRGGESDYTLVLVDGVQVNLAGGGFDFSSLTTGNVERVEIVRGPASALYGSDAMTGVIHVVTRTGRGAPTGSLTVEAGSFGRLDWSADVSGGTSASGYSLALSQQETDGILAFNNGRSSTVLSGRARLRPDDRTEVDVTLRASAIEYHFPTDGAGAVVDRNAFTYTDGTVARARVHRTLSERLSLEALIGLSETDGGTDDAQDGPADTLGFYGFTSLDDFRRTTAELRAHLRAGGAVLTGGVELEGERQRSFTESMSEFGPSNDRSSSERDNRAGFVHASGVVGALALTGGGRLEDNERFGKIATWQLGVSTEAPGLKGLRLKASAGRAIKEPTFFENFATGFATGNPDLDPERALSWELGASKSAFDGKLETSATYFHQRFEDLIQFTFAPPAPTDPSFFNVAEAASRGLELEVAGHLDRLSTGASWSWLSTEVIDSGFDSGPGASFVEGEALLRRPSHKWSAYASARVSGANVLARLTSVGSRADRDFSTFPATPVELPRYRLLSVSTEWDVSGVSGLSLTLRAENLLDEGYEEVLGFRAPGRGLYVGARATLGGGG